MLDNNCAYCMENELLDAFGIKICELPASNLYLFKEQSHLGRVVLAYKEHVSEIVNISEEERNAFFKDINHVATILHEIFNPQKINYGAYGDTGCHLHFHLVPKYKDELEWGGTFAMNPNKTFLSDEEYNKLISSIKEHL